MISLEAKRRLWVIYFGIVAFWAIQAYALLGEWMSEGKLFALMIDNKPYVSDFINVYGAGVLANRCLHQPTDIYDKEVQNNLQKELVAPVVPERPFYNQYPPLMFAIFLPLSVFSLPNAWIVWVSLSAVLSVAAVWLTVLPRFSSKFAKAVALASFLAAYPTWLSFRLGQTSLLLFPVVLLYFFLLSKKRPLAAALVSSLLLVKLQYIPVIAATGFASAGFAYLIPFAISGLLLFAGSTMIVGWDNLCRFPSALLSHESSLQVSGVSPEGMQNLRGFLVLLTGNDGTLVHAIAAVFALVVAIAIFISWWKLNKKGLLSETSQKTSTIYSLTASITLLLMLVSSPHTHTQDFIIALIPCAWLFLLADAEDSLLTNKGKRRIKIAVLSFPIISWIFFIVMMLFHLIKIQPFALWAFILAGLALSELGKILAGEKETQAPT